MKGRYRKRWKYFVYLCLKLVMVRWKVISFQYLLESSSESDLDAAREYPTSFSSLLVEHLLLSLYGFSSATCPLSL